MGQNAVVPVQYSLQQYGLVSDLGVTDVIVTVGEEPLPPPAPGPATCEIAGTP